MSAAAQQRILVTSVCVMAMAVMMVLVMGRVCRRIVGMVVAGMRMLNDSLWSTRGQEDHDGQSQSNQQTRRRLPHDNP